jgi:hypothetical protein
VQEDFHVKVFLAWAPDGDEGQLRATHTVRPNNAFKNLTTLRLNLFNYLTNYMELSPFKEAASQLATQNFPKIL